MQNSRQRHDPVRLLVRRLVLLAVFLLVVFASFGVWNIYKKDKESAELNEEAQAQLATLQAQESQLSGTVSTLESERGVEAALREQYDMGESGENEVIIVSATDASPVAAASSSAFTAWVRKVFPWW